MRILYVTNGFPYPLTSGFLRHYFLIRELSQRHSITLFSLVRNDFRAQHLTALAPFTDDIVTFRRAAVGNGFLRHTLGDSRMLMGLTTAVRSMWDAIEELTARQRFDVAFFSGKFTLPAKHRLGSLPVVADICDAGSVRLRGRMRHAGLRQLPSLMLKYVLMRRVENRVMRRTAHSVFASARDRNALTSTNNPRATVVPNGVDLDYWRRSSTSLDLNKIIFTGAMNYAPNVDAAMHLVQDIFPHVRRTIPQAELMIVGRDPLPQLIAAGTGEPGVSVTGYVEDMRPYLEQATIFAAPLRFAAGIQNKVLEAMAMEMHLIISPAAAGGVRNEAGREAPVTIVDGTEGFAESIVNQLRAVRDCPATNPNTRRYVQQYFGWRQAAEKLEDVFCQVVGGSQNQQASVSDPFEQPLVRTASG